MPGRVRRPEEERHAAEASAQPRVLRAHRHFSFREKAAIFNLAFIAGWVDACVWLTLAGTFAANVAGNILIGSVSVIGKGQSQGSLIRTIQTSCFLGGAILGGVLSFAFQRRGRSMASVAVLLLTVELVLLAMIGGVAGSYRVTIDAIGNDVTSWPVLIFGSIASLAMGLQTSTVRESFPTFPPTTIVITSATEFALALSQLVLARVMGPQLAMAAIFGSGATAVDDAVAAAAAAAPAPRAVAPGATTSTGTADASCGASAAPVMMATAEAPPATLAAPASQPCQAMLEPNVVVEGGGDAASQHTARSGHGALAQGTIAATAIRSAIERPQPLEVDATPALESAAAETASAPAATAAAVRQPRQPPSPTLTPLPSPGTGAVPVEAAPLSPKSAANAAKWSEYKRNLARRVGHYAIPVAGFACGAVVSAAVTRFISIWAILLVTVPLSFVIVDVAWTAVVAPPPLRALQERRVNENVEGRVMRPTAAVDANFASAGGHSQLQPGERAVVPDEG